MPGFSNAHYANYIVGRSATMMQQVSWFSTIPSHHHFVICSTEFRYSVFWACQSLGFLFRLVSIFSLLFRYST